MSLTADQWNGIKVMLPVECQKPALRLWNEAMRKVHAAAVESVPSTAALSEEEIKQFKLTILESMLLEMKRTGNNYTSAVSEKPQVLKI